jgi:thioredoxin reductase (NADPH)
MNGNHHNILIIGGGPAGDTAAIYASRANLEPLVLEGPQPGGQLTITTEVENFPGFEKGVPGPELVDIMRAQALRLGAEIRPETVMSVDLEATPFKVVTDAATLTCDALIIATGASARWLGIGKDKALSMSGGGVSACATCDGFFYRGREVAVVGGGDTALEEALYLTRFASHVHLIHRRDQFRASKVMQDRALANPKVTVHWHRAIKDLATRTEGDQERLEALVMQDTTGGADERLKVDGLFVAIGHQPNTHLFKGKLELDDNGYILTERGSSRTAVPGVFACGDVQDTVYRQAITAAGSGCMAAVDAERWLGEHPGRKITKEEAHV